MKNIIIFFVCFMLSQGVYSQSPTHNFIPHIRHETIQSPKRKLPLSEIKPFLNQTLILPNKALMQAPYIVALEPNSLLGYEGSKIYVMQLPKHTKYDQKNVVYGIYRPDGNYIDPNDPKNILGYKAKYIGEARLIQGGKPATLLVTNIAEGIHIKDRLWVTQQTVLPHTFALTSPKKPINASVIDLLDTLSKTALLQTVVLNKGIDAGLAIGNVLNIIEPGKRILDPNTSEGKKPQSIQLPNQVIGKVMIYHPFEKTSLALITESLRPIQIKDNVKSP